MELRWRSSRRGCERDSAMTEPAVSRAAHPAYGAAPQAERYFVPSFFALPPSSFILPALPSFLLLFYASYLSAMKPRRRPSRGDWTGRWTEPAVSRAAHAAYGAAPKADRFFALRPSPLRPSRPAFFPFALLRFLPFAWKPRRRPSRGDWTERWTEPAVSRAAHAANGAAPKAERFFALRPSPLRPSPFVLPALPSFLLLFYPSYLFCSVQLA